ncbi:UDP-N-acetylglucosamine 1-carboxyvinyltransferase [Paenibacillus rhizovicinus]|uniref:UDP-N-acetylglucosamine 1-carboxyvinyltransferase n=1 Tax=Paenibacillus rhizovicinus TaxID=2704463 RepID=A0A6C0P729_9BACL|nr:UDP-N-acetylglucosamine 1-carboxyvinyltransferase [Paenibacillus rhizovicinus]QHW34328.1 UDP-N-acetylglucosamine 1-carboxyvinyltransferase [Paenibacillus rhizovicinus]
MRAIKVERSAPLQGCVKIPGSKNSALALLAAACMADEPVTLLGIPDIADLRVIGELGGQIGLKVERDADGTVIVDPRMITSTNLDAEKSSSFRAAYYFVGALLAKYGKVSVGYPGGDDFVSRPMDQHIKALKQMGATFTFFDRHYTVEAAELKGSVIYFDTITSGATINAMFAAVRAKGTTVLLGAARDPEVTDTANLLNRMGARIVGAGTDHIRIEGVTALSGCTYTVIPDRLIAGAFLMAAGATGGCITVQDVIPEHMSSCIAKLREIGMEIETNEHSVTARSTGILRATRVRTAMYPGFATDLQQPLTALLTQANGKSIIGERIYPARFNHAVQLNRMGANIKVRSGVASINGGHPLRGALVHASDVRAGICLIVAGLCAEGTTTIAGVQHIERGYEDVVGSFRSLGAQIGLFDSEEQIASVASVSSLRMSK